MNEPLGIKRCPLCKTPKSLPAFLSGSGSRTYCYCSSCRKEYQTAWRNRPASMRGPRGPRVPVLTPLAISMVEKKEREIREPSSIFAGHEPIHRAPKEVRGRFYQRQYPRHHHLGNCTLDDIDPLAHYYFIGSRRTH